MWEGYCHKAVRLRVTIEAGATQRWHRYAGDCDVAIGIDRFGASAPGPMVMREYGFSADHIAEAAIRLLVGGRRRLKQETAVDSAKKGPHMSNGKNDIGMIGLALMGRNLVLNMTDRGFFVAAYNRTESVTQEFMADLQPGQRVQPCYSIEEFLDSLGKPRKNMMMVKAGRAVDAVIAELSPLLILEVGISGGESGPRNGPSMMPGGAADAYELVRPIFEAIAARAEGEPCVAYMGPGGAGHYAKCTTASSTV